MLAPFSVTRAQLPGAELLTIDPPVAKIGETLTLSLNGRNLEDLDSLLFSIPGITAEPVMLPASEYRKFPVQDGTKFTVTVPTGLAPGAVEVRAAGHFGISTSRPLLLLPADQTLLKDAGTPQHDLTTAPELPSGHLSWGRTDANQTDWWKLPVKKGQRFVIRCLAEAIDSRADATLVVVDGRGFELERVRDHLGRDPLIDFTAPSDGFYWIGVSDFLYRGGTEYPYVLSVSEGPWIEAVFPPAGQPGQVLEATLIGRNLEGGSPGEGLLLDGKPLETLPVRISIPAEGGSPRFNGRRPLHALLPGFDYRHAGSNPLPIGFAEGPVVAVTNDAAIATVTPPTEIAARFESPGDQDEFRFQATKDTHYWIEVIGDRLAGRIDPFLTVEKITRAEDGSEAFTKIKDGDDESDRGGARFDAGSRDTTLNFTADGDGEYRVQVVNQFASGGPLDTYRLSIREAAPDFSLLGISEREFHDARQAYPSALLLRKGGTALMRIVVRRKDGFDGPIRIEAADLPPGVSCPPVVAQPGEEVIHLVFHATPESKPWAGTLTVNGTTRIGDAEVTRPLRTGGLVWGSADYSKERLRSRLELTVPLAVSETETTPVHLGLATEGPLEVTLGEKLEIPIKILSRNGVKGNLAVSPFGLRGLTKPPTVNLAENADEGKLTLDFRNQPNVFSPAVGTWNFVLRGLGTTRYRLHPEAADRSAEEQALAEELAKKYTAEATATKTAAEQAKKALDQATQNLAGATEEAKPEAAKSVATAKAAHETAQAKADAAEKKRAEADKAKTDATARAKAAADKAKEKDVKFAAYSLPLTVVVKPAPEPEKKP